RRQRGPDAAALARRHLPAAALQDLAGRGHQRPGRRPAAAGGERPDHDHRAQERRVPALLAPHPPPVQRAHSLRPPRCQRRRAQGLLERGQRGGDGAMNRRGFTLVEMVIVIAIIVVLASLTFAVGTAVMANSEVRQTTATIKLLDAAVKEWETQADRKISFA